MTHQTRRGPPVECPLASLGRNATSVLDARQTYHHPLSSSPLNPQVYQMSRKSPNLSIDTDDILYTSTDSNHHHQDHQNGDGGGGGGGGGGHHNESIEMYHLSRSSSSSMEPQIQSQQLHQEPHRRRPLTTSRNYTPIESLLQYRSDRSTPCTYILHHQNPNNNNNNNNNNHDDSSDNGTCGSNRNNNNNCMIGGRRSVPLPNSNRCLINQRGGGGEHHQQQQQQLDNHHQQYYLEQKMDSLYLHGAIRGLPLGSETNHYKNERYYLDSNLCTYNENGGGNCRNDITDNSRIHHDNMLDSETSGSDRYLIERPARGSPGFLDKTSIHHNNNTTNNNCYSHRSNNSLSTNNNSTTTNASVTPTTTPQSTNTTTGHLEKRFHPSKVKSLSEGLSQIGRFSPSLDQGYATLVSPSPTSGHQIPGPWSKKGPCRSGPGFDRLPDEAVLKIFNWLDSCELCNVARVCRRFENLVWRPILWKLIGLKGEHMSGDRALKMIFRRLCGQTRNGACPEIERVMLSEGCRVSDKGLQLLTRRCPELTHLQLQSSLNVSNQALADALTKCSNLQHLDVTGCTAITSIAMNSNFEPPRRLLLQYLDLTDCTAIDDIGLKVVVRNCPQLVYLYLRRCIQITDAGLKFVPSFCIALKELSVSDCINITDFGLYELAKLGAALRYLSVAKCDRVSDAGLKVIARRCYKLRYLNARGCEAVSDDSITFLARSCPRLRALDIGKCDVSDAGLRALAESCPNLKKLSLRNCDMITDRGVQCIAYYCRGLQQLNIQDCQISIEGYRAVKKYCKRCIIEHTNPGFY